MSLQAIAAVASLPQPMPNQKNRSSRNFQFMKLPSSGDITVAFDPSPAGIQATLVHDIGFGNDEIVGSLSQGLAFPASWVKTGASYYLATPENASVSFLAFFEGDI